MKSAKYDISGFTNTGTVRQVNQDRILVNGNLITGGNYHLSDQSFCYCFVADGVGGNNAGEFAAEFVLRRLNEEPFYKMSERDYNNYLEDYLKKLNKINEKLLEATSKDPNLRGSATTLTGLVISADFFLIVHTGDSQMWLDRNDMFFKVTQDQVKNELEDNSPITSFFGGYENSLNIHLETESLETQLGDTFVICSDGLFKSLKPKTVKEILLSDNTRSASLSLLNNCLSSGSEDNVSAILVKCGT
jgi:serine/threonine protein phosphatase PrpC